MVLVQNGKMQKYLDNRVDGRIYSAISSQQLNNNLDDRADGRVILYWHQFTTMTNDNDSDYVKNDN